MYAFTHDEIHSELHATRTAEAAAWRLGRAAALAAPAAPSAPALRDRVGEALIAAGTRLRDHLVHVGPGWTYSVPTR